MPAGARHALATALLLAPVVLLASAAAVVVAPVGAGPSGHRADAVVALAGEPERLRVAEALAEAGGGTLVVSWVPGSDPDRDDRCQDGEEPPLCFFPLPVSTAGEARAIGRLAAEHGWDRVVVVTSRYHVGRAGMLVGQCAGGADVRLVSATDRLRPFSVLQESAGVIVGLTAQRAC